MTMTPAMIPALTLALTLALSTVGCQTVYRENSPDSVYTQDAEAARSLQVPPDLTDVSDAEQYVLPGNAGEPVKRNTLLPGFDTVQLVREGGQQWLAIDQSPEALWPVMQGFMKQEDYATERAEPVLGVLTSAWQAVPEQAGGLLGGLIGGKPVFERMAFRLERAGEGSRLFARAQRAASDERESLGTRWPPEAAEPENTSELLIRLLLFIGLEEQRVRGMLSTEEAAALLEPAELQSTVAGRQLVVHRGFGSAFDAVTRALETLDYTLEEVDRGVGQIEARATSSPPGEPALLVDVNPVNISAVQVSLGRSDGQSLASETESQLLDSLLAAVNRALPG